MRMSRFVALQIGRAVDRGYANPHLLPDLTSDTESEGEGEDGVNDGASVRGGSVRGGSVWGGAPSVVSKAVTKMNARARAPPVAGSVRGGGCGGGGGRATQHAADRQGVHLRPHLTCACALPGPTSCLARKPGRRVVCLSRPVMPSP